MGKLIDLTGQRFGRLTVVERAGLANGQSTWRCKCDCGNETVSYSQALRRGDAQSCGCLCLEHHVEATTQHGKCQTRIYAIWRGIKKRCNNPSCKDYKRYGGKGVSVCTEWANDFQAFYGWSMANGYSDNLTLDRKDASGNYCPENCRWATKLTQANNRLNNVRIEIDGEEKTIAEWARVCGLNPHTIGNRYRKGIRGKELIKTKKDVIDLPTISR